MAKYRGSDGWLYDDSVGKPGSREEIEFILPGWVLPEKAATEDETPVVPKPEEDPNRGPRSKCPNCDLTASWRRLEGYCAACGWGKNEAAFAAKRESESFACCLVLSLGVVCPLLVAGLGYAALGFGGLLAGLALGLAIPLTLVVAATLAASGKRGSEDESD